MPIFSRRTTQSLIDEVSKILDSEDMKTLITKLNADNVQSLHTLWEIIVIYLLSKHGSIEYEVDHAKRTVPDIYFKNDAGFEMVADITCISDHSQMKENDVDFFLSELGKVATKVGIRDLSGFDIRIEDIKTPESKKIKLKLPHKNKVRQFILSRIKPFLNEISQERKKPNRIIINEDNIELSISYNPNSEYLSAGHLAHTVALTLENNPLYNRLKKKREQLKRCGYEGLRGVIVCDGDCGLLTSTFTATNSFSANSIIRNFLNSQETISFVLLIHVEENSLSMSSYETSRKLKLKHYVKDFYIDEFKQFVASLNSSISFLPDPINTAKNAIHELNGDQLPLTNTFYGGGSLADNKFSISARVFKDLLSGKLSSEQVLEDHGLIGDALKAMIEKGYKLKSINLVEVEDFDDDWLEIEFEDSFDAAVTKYTVNK